MVTFLWLFLACKILSKNVLELQILIVEDELVTRHTLKSIVEIRRLSCLRSK